MSEDKPSSAERNEQLLKKIDHNYSMLEDGAESIGRIGLSYQKRSEFSEKPKKKKHLADVLHRLLEHQRWLENRMEELEQEIDRLTADIDKRSERLELLDGFMGHFRSYGEYQLAEDGYPEDETIRSWMFEFEQETGAQWNPSSGNSSFLRNMKDRELQTISDLDFKRKEKLEEWDVVKEAYDSTSDTLEKLEQGEYVSEADVSFLLEEEELCDDKMEEYSRPHNQGKYRSKLVRFSCPQLWKQAWEALLTSLKQQLQFPKDAALQKNSQVHNEAPHLISTKKGAPHPESAFFNVLRKHQFFTKRRVLC